MGVNVKMNHVRIKQLSESAVKALKLTMEAVHIDIGQSETVPMRTGALSGEQFFTDYENSAKGKVSLVNDTPYARRLYYHPEYNFNKAFHANAGAAWFEPYLTGDKKDFARKAFARLYRSIGGT
jgi:hypothetical protein